MRSWLVAILLFLTLGAFGFSGFFVYDQAWGPAAQLRAARKALLRRDFAEASARVQPLLKARPGAEVHLVAAQIARRAVGLLLPAGPGAPSPVPGTQAGAGLGSYEKAAGHLKEYRRLGGLPEVVRLEEYLARAQRGELAAVEAPLRQLLAGDYPDPVTVLEALAKGYLTTFRLAEAEECLSRWLDVREDAQALLWRGWVWENFHNVPRALADYRRAVELAPDNAAARLDLARGLLGVSQPKEAAEQYAWLYGRRPEDPAVRLGLARCRLELGETGTARRLLDDLLAAHPDDVAALTERGRLALREKQLGQAEALLRKAVSLAPFDYQPAYALGLCLEQAGKRDEARTCLARANRIEADLKQMTESLRQVNVTPHDPAPRLRAGEILMRNGLESEGVRWLHSALQQDSGHAPTHRALADYYARRGKGAEAAYHRGLADRAGSVAR